MHDKVLEFYNTLHSKTGMLRHAPLQNFNKADDATVSMHSAIVSEELKETHEDLDLIKEMVHAGVDVPVTIKAGLLKEFCDTIYVIRGYCNAFKWNLDEAFDRVCDNNLLKLNTGTIREDGKLVKAENHPKVDLTDLV